MPLIRRKFVNVTPLSESATHSVATPRGRVFKGVTLIKAGLGNKRDRNFYPAEVLQSAVKEGLFEGLRAFADHPDSVSEEIQPERTIRDFVGVYENARYDNGVDGVRADLRILKANNWLSDTIDELIEIGHADKIGLSINGRGATEPVKRQLEESGEMSEVNELKKFLELRSTDIVTEAGAGGGFSQLLESARRAKESTHMDRKQLRKAIAEAAAAGDDTKVLELSTQLAEISNDTAEGDKVSEDFGGKKAVPFGKKGKKAAPANDNDADDMNEADGDEDIDDAVDDAVAEADGDEAAAADGDEADEAEGEDVEEADEAEGDEAEGDDVEEAALVPLQGSKQKIRGATGTTGTVQGPVGKFTSNARRPKKGTFKTKPGSTRPIVRTTGGARAVESSNKDAVIARLQAKNERLAEALRDVQSANTARKLLKESKLPVGVATKLVKKLIGLSEADQRDEIGRHVALVESIAQSVRESMASEYDEVEGAGASLRESNGGSRETDIEDIFESTGLTLK